MALVGYSVPQTLTDDAGNTLRNVTVDVTGPSSYTGTATSDATTGILRIGPVAPGDYTISYQGRSAPVPVYAQAEDILAEAALGGINGGVTSIATTGGAVKTGAVTLEIADLSDGSDLALAQDVTDDIAAAFGAATVAALTIETVAASSYTVVPADKGKGKKFTSSGTSGVVAVTVPTAASIAPATWDVGSQIDLIQYGTGQVQVLTPTNTVSFPYTAVNHYDAASQHAYSVTLPNAATLADHDGYLVAVALPVSSARDFSAGMPTGFSLVTSMWGPSGVWIALFQKTDIDAATDGGQTLTFTHSGSNVQGSIALIGLRGVDRANFVGTVTTTGTGNTKTAPGRGSPGTLVDNAVELVVGANQSGTTANGGGGHTSTWSVPAGITKIIETSTDSASLNNTSVMFGNGVVAGVGPAGSTIPSRALTTDIGTIGAAATLSIKPYVPATVVIRSRGGAYKTAGQYGAMTLTNLAIDEWLLTGDATT